MRAERRHELQQNKLAQWLADVLKSVRPHVNKILLGVTVLLVAVVIVSAWRAYATRGRSAAWEKLFEELGHRDTGLDEMADESPNSLPGRWAALVVAGRHLAQGSQLLLTNKENAAQELRKAAAGYTTAIGSDGKGDQELLEQAYFGRARAYESLAGTDRANKDGLDKAVADYGELLKRWPSGPYSAAAKRQLDMLGSTHGRKFYEKLADYRPKPPPAPGVLPPLGKLAPKGLPGGPDASPGPSLEEILKGLEATTPEPGAATPPMKPGTEMPPAGKAQPPVLEPPKTGSAVPGPVKPEAAKPEPPKSPPTPEPAKAAPAKPESTKK